MQSAILITVVTAFISLASAAPLIKPTNLYLLTNCFNNITFDSYAEIDYYFDGYNTAVYDKAPRFPDLIAIINPTSSIDYEDGAWTTLPGAQFNLTVVIDEDAYTAVAGTLVGTAESKEGKLECMRLTRVDLYSPGVSEQCYSDYECLKA